MKYTIEREIKLAKQVLEKANKITSLKEAETQLKILSEVSEVLARKWAEPSVLDISDEKQQEKQEQIMTQRTNVLNKITELNKFIEDNKN